ncbi:MAG: aminoglycoside phosphotransferase family protein [Chloroflexota bacterium]
MMRIEQQDRQPSEFQQPVDEHSLRRELSRALADDTVIKVTELKAGLFNNTYRVDTEKNAYILKVAPHPSAQVLFNEQNLMQQEKMIAPILQSLSPLIPRYLSFFSIDGRDASLQTFVEGRLWHNVIEELAEAENTQLWQQLGTFAKMLHGYRGRQFGYPSSARLFDHWSEFIKYNVTGLIEDCQRHNVLHDEVKTYWQMLPQFSKFLDQVNDPKLLHGDLWPRNVLIEGSGDNIHLKAVFDAERAFWGDPVADWVLILYGVPNAFWTGYGENLLQTSHSTRIAIYKGMYFIVNILECVRFESSDKTYRELLSGINSELAGYLDSHSQ